MGIKADDLYWRIYADNQLKVFTLTMVPLSEPTHRELAGNEAILKEIAKGLQAIGWTWCQRRAFEHLVKRGSVNI